MTALAVYSNARPLLQKCTRSNAFLCYLRYRKHCGENDATGLFNEMLGSYNLEMRKNNQNHCTLVVTRASTGHIRT